MREDGKEERRRDDWEGRGRKRGDEERKGEGKERMRGGDG